MIQLKDNFNNIIYTESAIISEREVYFSRAVYQI